MAQIIEEKITIVLSHLVKDGETSEPVAVNAEFLESIQAVAQELAGDGVLVEVKEE